MSRHISKLLWFAIILLTILTLAVAYWASTHPDYTLEPTKPLS
jgi:hypothetical protein